MTYDGTGNRNNGSYATSTGNRLTSDGTWSYSYDDEGNQTKKSMGSSSTTWKYVYNNKNQLTEAKKFTEDPDSVGTAVLQLEADYKYDILGNRVEKSVDADGVGGGSATVSRFAYDGWNSAKPAPIGTENFDIWGDFTSGGSLTTRYLRGDNVDELVARVDGSTAYWYLHDHPQSIRKVIDNNAAVRDSIVYDAFGNILSETDANYRGRYAWTGLEIDVETQLQYNRARYYDATTGRWISQDPLVVGMG